MDFLQRGVAWLNQQRVQHLSQMVTYQRGGESVQIAATLGTTSVEITDDTGATVQSPQMDFIVSADALVLNGTAATPRVGDRIFVADAIGKTLVYEVLSLQDGRHYRPCDGNRQMLRIHAKQVDEVLE